MSWEELFLPTAYVVRAKVMFSVCSHLGGYTGQFQMGGSLMGRYPDGGTPPQVSPSDLAGGYPDQGDPTPGTSHPTWLGGTPVGPSLGVPQGGYPISGTPIRPGQGVLQQGGTSPCVPPIRPGWGVPYLRYLPPIGPGWGGTPMGGGYPTSYRITDGVLDTPRSVCPLRSRRRTFLSFIVLTLWLTYFTYLLLNT